ncbi:unnamed protein product, partial [Coregonus sp. 'balchen']
MKQIKTATDAEYGTLTVKVSGYDMILVEHYSQYIYNLCNRLGVKLSQLNTTLCPIFMEVLLKNQPEGVQLSVKPHTEADYKSLFQGTSRARGTDGTDDLKTEDFVLAADSIVLLVYPFHPDFGL